MMILNYLAHLRTRQLLPLVAEHKQFYSQNWTPSQIQDWQLNQFNQQWQIISRQVPYFANLAREKNLPVQFSCWQEFQTLMPLMDRKTVQNNREALTNQTKKPDWFRITGGSTSEPVQLPAWNSEWEYENKDRWYARSWYGVNPSDKLFLIWGHRHLLGRGLIGWLNCQKRTMKDKILGYFRFSAYDISEQRLQEAGYALLEFRPSYLIAYAGALDRFARVNSHRKAEFRNLGLKVAIATTESFPRSDSVELITDVLGCPVAMEYGAIETGLIAHQNLEGYFSVFWHHYFVEGLESKHLPGTYELYLTSLYPRCFPLVRYAIGDLATYKDHSEYFSPEFKTLIGRCNDFIALKNGSIVHPQAFRDVISWSQSISDFQVIQSLDGQIKLRYVGTEMVKPNEISEVKRRLQQINPQLANIDLQQVESLEKSIAGKTRRIIRES